MTAGMPKKNVFVLGCGRSGTSMVAGLFAKSGMFQGTRLHSPSVENPKGYFEDALVNGLNNEILSGVNPQPETINGLGFRQDAVGSGNGWLARVPLSTVIPVSSEQRSRIFAVTANRPFCLKDPRFCYLHDHWVESVPGAGSICVFREPEVAVESILRSLRTRPGLFDVALSVNQAFEVWALHYLHVLRKHASSGDWLFVHFDQVLTRAGVGRITEFVGFDLDTSFPDMALRRTHPSISRPANVARIYDELMSHATA